MTLQIHLPAPRQLIEISSPMLYLESYQPGLDWRNGLKRCGLASLGVRGRFARSVRGLFDEFAGALQFPRYFGENWAAFNECLSDMDWITLWPGFVIFIFEPGEVLADADEIDMVSLAESFDRACQRFSQPLSSGEMNDRPAVPFHVVLQSEEPGDLARWLITGTNLLPLDLSNLTKITDNYDRWRLHLAQSGL